MKKAFQELSGWMAAVIVFASVTAILTGFSLMERIGQRLEVQGEDFSCMADSEAVAAVCERKEPIIRCMGKKVWTSGESISVSQVFEAVDADGKKLEATVMDITDQEGNSVMGCYREDIQQAIFLERGIYTFVLRSMDEERKSGTEKISILVDDR